MKKIALVLLIGILCLSMVACGNPKITNSADGYIGTNYEDVVAELKDCGFTNIKTQEVQDLTSASDMQDGGVGEISVDGVTDFEEGTKFEADVPIIVTYHTIPKLQIPVSSDDLQNYDHESIADMFSESGFQNVSAEVVYDLNPSLGIEFENEVEIDFLTYFAEGDEVPFDAQIVVVCHRPYTLYTLKLHVSFPSNLLFSKYDVTLEVDDYEETLKHGTDGDFEFTLKEGEYTIAFASEESSTVKGEVTIYVDCDIDASYRISCGGDEITVTEEYVDKKQDLAEGEVKVLSDETEFWFNDYKDVIKILKEWGFTNIKEVPLYDIYLGWTDEGEVDDVTIDNSDDYKRGDVFKEDVEVIVSYHMPYEDDPARATEPTELPTTPSSVFYSTNDYETAKNGNTGVFAYRDRGASYDIYWIIDFDEGYVYYFTDGNGETFCDRLKIVSGTLNDKITITYHDGGDTWSYKLHFKYVNHPETLIMVDQNGFELEYSTTDLDDALALRDTKNVKDY